jgi:hypothetical protein
VSKPHVQARGFLWRFAPYVIAIGLAFSPLTACYAHASPDGVYVAHGGGYYYDDGDRNRRRYYRDSGPRYRRDPDVYYDRGDPYRRDYRRHRHHHHHYHERW